MPNTKDSASDPRPTEPRPDPNNPNPNPNDPNKPRRETEDMNDAAREEMSRRESA